MKPEIVKVQRPLNDRSAHWLIYAEGRNKIQTLPQSVIPPYAVKAMSDDYKAYFEAQWSSTDGWAIGDRVPDEEGF